MIAISSLNCPELLESNNGKSITRHAAKSNLAVVKITPDVTSDPADEWHVDSEKPIKRLPRWMNLG